MKQLQYKRVGLLLFVCGMLFASCDRSYKATIVSETPPGLQVNVKTTSGAGVEAATVKVYDTQQAWESEGAATTEQQTPVGGTVIFSAEELGDPGVYYLMVTKGAQKAKVQTKFLLLTDGVTFQNVVLQP